MSCQHGASLGTTILLACYLVAQWEVQMCACVSSDCQELAVQEELNGYKLSWVNLSQENMEDRVHGEQETQTSSPANRDNYKLLGLLQDGPMSFANWIASTVMIISLLTTCDWKGRKEAWVWRIQIVVSYENSLRGWQSKNCPLLSSMMSIGGWELESQSHLVIS